MNFKKTIKKKQKLILLIFSSALALSLIFTSAFVFLNVSSENEQNGEFNFLKEQKRLEKIFEHEGTEPAYRYFNSSYQKYDSALVHTLAHYVGEQIYKREGINGIKICDDSYTFGCFHGLFAYAFATDQNTDTAIIAAANICKQYETESMAKIGGCIHGLGHGIMGTNNYDLTGLKKSLLDCDLLSAQNLSSECYRGVFMEYNRRKPNFAYKKGEEIRKFDPEKPFEPCSGIPMQYQDQCYIEQVPWWMTSISTSNGLQENRIKKIVEYCGLLEHTGNKIACFEGIGLAIPIGREKPYSDYGSVCAISNKSAESLCLKGIIHRLLIENYPNPDELCGFIANSDLRQNCLDDSNDFSCQALARCNEEKDK